MVHPSWYLKEQVKQQVEEDTKRTHLAHPVVQGGTRHHGEERVEPADFRGSS